MVKRIVLTLLFGLTFCGVATAAGPLFEDTKLISIQLTGDFSTLLREKDKEKLFPAILKYSTETDSVEIPVELQVRGNARLEHCKVPGLRITFPKSGVDGLFIDQRKLKLVTQCRKSEQYENYLLQEFLIYKMYERLTGSSFKSRLVTVDFKDSGKRSRDWSDVAFFIEDKKRLANRLGATVVEKPKIKRSALAPSETNLVSVFQFMIANTDYSLLKGEGEEACCHNMKLIDKGEGYIPVPYDFDLAGLINTTYALPPQNLGISRVSQRAYRGFCGGNEHLPETLALFQTNKSGLYATLDDERLSDRTVKKMHRFLDGFYKIIDDPKQLDQKILKKCRPKPGSKK